MSNETFGFFSRVRIPADIECCWDWVGYKNGKGYGMTHFNGKTMNAHRASLLISGEPLVPGLHVDHLCRNRACVNPLHLRQVTCRENLTAPSSLSAPAMNALKSKCPLGHQYDESNTIIAKGQNGSGRYRRCRECERQRHNRDYRLNAEQRRSYRRRYLAKKREEARRKECEQYSLLSALDAAKGGGE